MTKEETVKVLSVLRASYPKYYQNLSREDQANLIAVWSDIFEEDEGTFVLAAVKSYIRSNSSGFPPAPGQITQIMYNLSHPNQLTEQEAWGMVMNALRNSIYCSEQEFEKLPVDIQRTVGSARQLRDWAMYDVKELGTVVSSNFQRSYKARIAENREMAMLPQQARQMIETLSDTKRIE